MTASKILELARSQIGVMENPAGSNNVLYNTWYYGRAVSGSGLAWCAAFLGWLFNQAGAGSLFYGGRGTYAEGGTASCTTLMNHYRAQGQLVSDFRPGDIVFFTFDGGSDADHVGLLETYENGKFYTIEGNTSITSDDNGGAVMRRERSAAVVVAVARPNYITEEITMDNTPHSWGEAAVAWATANGIMLGDERGNLRLSDKITREETVVMLYRTYLAIAKLFGG